MTGLTTKLILCLRSREPIYDRRVNEAPWDNSATPWETSPKHYPVSSVSTGALSPQISPVSVKSLFSRLAREQLTTETFELYSDQYWTRITSEGFMIYEKIYQELIRKGNNGDGSVSLYDFAKHFAGLDPNPNIHQVWYRLDLIGKKAPRNYILAALYMLHMSKSGCYPEEEPTITRDGKLTENRLFVVARFGNWIPCQCGNLNKVGFIVLSSRKKGSQSATCGAACCFPDGSNMIWRGRAEDIKHLGGLSEKNVRSENWKVWQKTTAQEPRL